MDNIAHTATNHCYRSGTSANATQETRFTALNSILSFLGCSQYFSISEFPTAIHTTR